MKTRKQSSGRTSKSAVEAKISQILHRARLDKHYSLDDLHRLTKIKTQYLKDLDTGHFKGIPEGFYLRAFIKEYANTVGLDGSELLRRFNNSLPDLQDPHYMGKVSEDKLLVRAEKQRVQNRHSAVRKYIPLVIVCIVVFLVLVGVWVVASHYHNGLTSDSDGHSTDVSGESSVSRPRHKTHHKRTVKHKHPVVIKRGSDVNNQLVYHVSSKVRPIRLRLVSSKAVKVTVKNGRKSIAQDTLKPGHYKLLKVSSRDRQMQLAVGNNAKVKVKVNHKVKPLNHKPLTQSIILKFSK